MLRLFQHPHDSNSSFHSRLANTNWINPFNASSSTIRKLLLFTLCTSSALRAQAAPTNYAITPYNSDLNTACTTPAYFGNVTETCIRGRGDHGNLFRIALQVSLSIDIDGLNNALAQCKVDHDKCTSDDPKITQSHATCVEGLHHLNETLFPATIYTFGYGDINNGKCSLLNGILIGGAVTSYFEEYLGDITGCALVAMEKYCGKVRAIKDAGDTYFPLENIEMDHTTRDILLAIALSSSALAGIGLMVWCIKTRNNNGYVKLQDNIEAGQNLLKFSALNSPQTTIEKANPSNQNNNLRRCTG